MTNTNDIHLSNIDPEDLDDSLFKIERSFGIKFAADAFKYANTFGDICDSITNQIIGTDKNDCTTQQAFYKVRKAISVSQQIEESSITPRTMIAAVFPRHNRRQTVKRFQQALGFPVDILTMKNWLAITLAIGFIVSLIIIFFSWKLAIAGLVIFTTLSWIAGKFSKELAIKTVRHLAEKITREHYAAARRHSGTINRNEIMKVIQDVFIADHHIAREHLTSDASLV